ncbi:hypothetical protein SNOG_02959 [Parastagonospora nodorum SN15]|uniref:Uncharacterized protein n=1 Tax=Phaeosphaeria nodorum (strain SN15 / ATCC MYA-4574 / FGSC 10173) TaxID=321614 RepID=Q0UZ55_PHANO|nr:hypothetical protein SNOG_02959 [Parastagonospora nodorum SN15]EAT89690.1 hypothetical protein SNOG_02959 [Parastagonospora nodorum SN15]
MLGEIVGHCKTPPPAENAVTHGRDRGLFGSSGLVWVIIRAPQTPLKSPAGRAAPRLTHLKPALAQENHRCPGLTSYRFAVLARYGGGHCLTRKTAIASKFSTTYAVKQ